MKHALHGRGLSRQIVLSMSAVVVSVTLLVMVGSYFFYSFLFVFHPKFFEDDSWIPTGPEWVWLIFIMLVGVAIAVYVAVRLARRILAPLTSVTSGLRQVAQGDLTVRAELRNAGWGEASLLVNDFNSMAERIQSMTAERAIWNASIAHELRTPVTILRGRLQGLAEGVFTPDEAQFRNLLAQVEGLSRLIEDLRTVSLADSGHLELYKEELDLSPGIEGLVTLLRPDFEAHGFHLDYTLTTIAVCCDAARLRQVLMALLDNAKRYAHPGRVHVHTWASDDTYFLRVEDEGPGISDELASNLFNVFQRGEASRSRAMGGSGLGLSVVRAIAEVHGGHASYRKGEKGGALFEIALPR